MPVSAPAGSGVLRPAGTTRGCATYGGALLGADGSGVLQESRHVAAEPGRRNPGRDHVRGKARDREFASYAGAGAGDWRGVDWRGRSVAGPGISAAVRAPDRGLGDQ